MTSDILYLIAITCAFWVVVLLIFLVGLDYFAELSNDVHKRFYAWQKEREREELQDMIEAGDYWDGGDINYDTGEIRTDSRPSIRYPKNRDRAYAGSAERFHDGGGQDS